MPDPARSVVISANSSWNIAHFRAGLIRALRGAGYALVAVAPDDSEARVREMGIAYQPLRINRSGMNPAADLALLLAYRRILKRVQPRAFLGFTVKPNIYGALAAESLGIPAILNVSGLGTAFIRSGPLQAIVTALYRRAFRRAATVFFQNPDDRRLFLERRLVHSEQTRLLPGSGVDLDRFAPSPLPAGPATFLLVSRLLSDKGVREFVAAARRLRAACPELRFRLLGPLDEGNRSAISADELRAWVDEGVVDYLGQSDDVRPFIADSTAVVLPSYREGLPRSLLEAAAMARPLIATDVPGCREVVEEGVNGYLCLARDADSLATAMMRLAELPDAERMAMGDASRRMVRERFSERLVTEAYLDVLGGLGPR